MHTLAEIHAKFLPLLQVRYTLPKTKNKGLPGLFLETLLGIPHGPNALDCSDGEVKVFPVQRSRATRNGVKAVTHFVLVQPTMATLQALVLLQ